MDAQDLLCYRVNYPLDAQTTYGAAVGLAIDALCSEVERLEECVEHWEGACHAAETAVDGLTAELEAAKAIARAAYEDEVAAHEEEAAADQEADRQADRADAAEIALQRVQGALTDSGVPVPELLHVADGVEELVRRMAAEQERHDAAYTAERQAYADMVRRVIEATGLEPPVNGWTAVEAVTALRERLATLAEALREARDGRAATPASCGAADKLRAALDALEAKS